MKASIEWRVAGFVVAVAGILFCWWHWDAWRHRAWVAAGFGARIGCSCRYVEGRLMDGCRTDFSGLRGMELVLLSDDPDTAAVEARVPLLAHRSARLVPGFGCVIDPR